MAATVYYPLESDVGRETLFELKRHENGHMNDRSGSRGHEGWRLK